MVLILLFKLLPNRSSDNVGISLVRWPSFGGKVLDKYFFLMLSPSRFAILRKVKVNWIIEALALYLKCHCYF